jgi:hypothetical protein
MAKKTRASLQISIRLPLLETTSSKTFRATMTAPEFCPNPTCPNHHSEENANKKWYSPHGSHSSKAWGKTPRFICKNCGKTCSSQTFSIHYWAHSFIDHEDLNHRINSCAGYRQIGRALGHSYSVLKNRYLRLSRNFLNLFDTALSGFPLTEDIAFDGFESFLRNQYIPSNFNIAVGSVSQLPYAFSLSLMRRKGAMTSVQKKNRTILDAVWRPQKGALVNSCKIVFRDVCSLYLNRNSFTPFTLYTDEKREYPIALSELGEYRHLVAIKAMKHKTINSRISRTRKNPLFPVNYIDREIRKNSAAHVRETVRFDREISMAEARMVLTLGYHSFHKPYRITNKVNDQQTHAEKAALLEQTETRRAFTRLYTHRHVWTRQNLHSTWMEDIWLRKHTNPPIVNFKTGEVKNKGQPGNGWVARHLVV